MSDNIPNTSVMCGKEEEPIDHIFLQCEPSEFELTMLRAMIQCQLSRGTELSSFLANAPLRRGMLGANKMQISFYFPISK